MVGRRWEHRAWVGIVALLATASATVNAAPRNPDEIRRDYLAIADALPCGDPEDGSPDWNNPVENMPTTLKRLWPLVGEWAAAYLDRHPRASAEQLRKSYRKLAPTRVCPQTGTGDWRLLRVSAEQLATGGEAAYAVTANNVFFGTLFVVAREKNGPFRVAWTIKDVATQGVEDSDKIAWKAGLRGWEDGPLHGGVRLLAPDASGAPRFAVDAEPMGFLVMGCTQAFQLSLWRWDGARAQPLLMKCYHQSICAEEADHVPSKAWLANGVRIPVKASTQTMFPFGSATEPQAIWTISVNPDGVEDLGEKWSEPDLQFVDGALARLLRKEDTADSIDPYVAAALYGKLAPRVRDPGGSVSIGMLGRFSVRVTDEGRIATMHGGGSGDVTVAFTLVDRNGRPFVTAAEVKELD